MVKGDHAGVSPSMGRMRRLEFVSASGSKDPELTSTSIPRSEGRELFGLDPAGYDRARPPYPEAVYDLLVGVCGLGPDVATFEVGAGAGLATRRLVALGARPLVAIEPDPRLAAHLRSQRLPITVIEAPFESAEIDAGGYALGTSATAFHWVDQRVGLERVARALAPGGWWAVWWHVFGDCFERHDPFHEATKTLLAPLPMGPTGGADELPFPCDRTARLADIAGTGAFEPAADHQFRWTLTLDAAQTRALYMTYSSITRLERDERTRVLDEIERIARDEFGSVVERNMITPIYLARRI